MSTTHLFALESALLKSGIEKLDEHEVVVDGISAMWVLRNVSTQKCFSIYFEGVNGLETSTIQNSYGCFIGSARKTALYFARINRSWPVLLDRFIEEIDAIISFDTNYLVNPCFENRQVAGVIVGESVRGIHVDFGSILEGIAHQSTRQELKLGDNICIDTITLNSARYHFDVAIRRG